MERTPSTPKKAPDTLAPVIDFQAARRQQRLGSHTLTATRQPDTGRGNEFAAFRREQRQESTPRRTAWRQSYQLITTENTARSPKTKRCS